VADAVLGQLESKVGNVHGLLVVDHHAKPDHEILFASK